MKKMLKILMTSCVLLSFTGSISALASMDMETESSVAGISVALNNYFASSLDPDQELSQVLSDESNMPTAVSASNVQRTVPQAAAAKSAYENIAVSQVTDYVNVRTEPNTTSEVVGKIYNNCAATILESVDGEGGTWYKIQSGSVTGYIKAEYFKTGAEAEALAKKVGTTYATVVGTPTLRLRENPDLDSKTLTLLAEGAHYIVVEEQGEFVKIAVDTDLEGYVFKDYVNVQVEFEKAVSVAEEKAKEEEAARLKREAEEAMRKLEQERAAAADKKTTEAPTTEAPTTTAAETTKAEDLTIEANPNGGGEETVAPPTTAAPTTEAPTTQPPTTASSDGPGGPGSSGPGSSELTSATRNAIVAYAKQFLGNPYVYGGTSLTNGADCSGFTQGVFAHFGITTGRSSRDQAAKGREISTSAVQPGDLLFYASGNYINHVALYIGGGQVIHASSPTTGIIISPSNYRTPCKAVTFLD
ncbi:MAG: NlpC/P60 family protein [Lachnospiraceae bacterium]